MASATLQEKCRNSRGPLRMVGGGFAALLVGCSVVVAGDLTSGTPTLQPDEVESGAVESGAADGASTSDGPDGNASPPTSDYAAAVMVDSPVAYWRLNETSGAAAATSEVGGFTCTFHGTPLPGQPGTTAELSDTSYEFDGLSYLDCGNVLDFSGTDTYSIELWLQARVIDSAYRFALGKNYAPASGTRDTYGIFVQENYGVAFERYANGTPLNAAFESFTAGGSIYHHVVGAYTGTELLLFVDGAHVDTTTNAGAAVQKNVKLLIGATSGFESIAFKGGIDEIAV